MALICVVEDEAALAELLGVVIEHVGHAVETYTDPVAALDRLLDLSRPVPELLVLDVMMPKLDGVELHARLQGSPRTAGMRVVVISADGGFAPAFRGAPGVERFLRKPFTMATLKDAVESACPN